MELAYAITIHKSQGSEYDTVFMHMTKASSSMLYRNLVYTGISRARKRVELVGDIAALNHAMKRTPVERKSGLVEKVAS